MKVLIRADASADVGTGHVMRCLALSEWLREQGAEITFVSRRVPGNICDLITTAGYQVCYLPIEERSGWHQDAEQTIEVMKSQAPVDWLIIDHYGIDSRWESLVRPYVLKIMVIDDLADRIHECDLLLDQNYFVESIARYEKLVPESCTKLLGPRYALLRPEFVNLRPPQTRDESSVKRVCVFMSGNDPDNVTARVMKALDAVVSPEVEADIVVGVRSRYIDELISYCSKRPSRQLHVQTSRMAKLLAEADLAIGAGGVSTWERACLGVPSLVLGLATNQFAVAEAMARNGAHLYLGSIEDLDDAALRSAIIVLLKNRYLRSALAQRAFSLVDGRGVNRVAKHLLCSKVDIRYATDNDCDLLFRWRNHPDTRRYFFDSSPLTLSAHRHWFTTTLADNSRSLLIGMVNDKEVGVLRYDFLREEARVSVYLDPARQGQGYGSALLAAGTNWLKKHHADIRSIVAEVLPDNELSWRAFLTAGFRETHRCLRFEIVETDLRTSVGRS